MKDSFWEGTGYRDLSVKDSFHEGTAYREICLRRMHSKQETQNIPGGLS